MIVQGQTRTKVRAASATMALGTLGIVYGDIGTSPLYALKEAAKAAAAGGELRSDAVMGPVSLVLWALVLIVAAKYAVLMMRADNDGEGGVMAMLALLGARHAPPRSWRAVLLIVGLVGAALLYGDGAITPAVSVLSAVTGGEAMYADMGHFGRLPIRLAWFTVVLPALALNYLGQGGLLLADPAAIDNPFFQLAPAWAHVPLVLFATLATVVASHAIHVPRALRGAVEDGRLAGVDCDHLSYFISHEAASTA